MFSPRAIGSSAGQALPWYVAAFVVLAASGLIATWLNATALAADRDTLRRGADAVQSTVEEQVRILELAGTASQSLAGQSAAKVDLDTLVREVDISVLSALVAVLSYPIDGNGAGTGTHLLNVDSPIRTAGFEIPEIDLSFEEFEELNESGDAFFSPPLPTPDGEWVNYFVARPVVQDAGLRLIGVAFRPDRMLESAIEAAGEGQYAINVVDLRFGDEAVLTLGKPASTMAATRRPDGVTAALQLIVYPGEDFPSAQSPWLIGSVLLTGVVIALLILWMGKLSRARAEGLAERLRLAQELNESKDRFLATVSHELRTPLTVVLGVAAEIGPHWQTFTETDRQELMTMMTEQAVEAANIVEDLLVAARSDPSQLRLAVENTPLRTHLDYALGSLTDEGRSRVVCHAGDVSVLADTTRLRQILRNLLENAVRYGGDMITVDSTKLGNRLIVVVADDGSDLAEGDLERIFEPYEQSADSGEALAGVGIGLYVSRLLAKLMGGDLDCVREDGWTKFRLRLPTADDESFVDQELAQVR